MAVKWSRAAAEQGHILAQDRLGWMYSYGQGVAQDHEEAARWFRAAAEQGNAHAQGSLGIVYGKGLGVPQDSEEAVRWFRAAAEQGDARAQYNLGLAYRDGEYGVTVDRYAAWEWFTAAARQGNANATEAARGLPVPPHPARAFDIDTGTIWIGGGIEGSRDGTMLFLDLWNKTERSVWAEVEFQLPGTGQLLQEFKRVKGVDGARYSWPIDSVTWSTEYRFRISVFDDKKRRKPLGAEDSFYYFDENEAESFEAGFQAGGIEYGGFRELHWESLKAEVPGSLAAGELRYHIMLSLFAEESKLHKECEHTALRAEQYGADDRSIPASEMKPELQKLHSKIRASDKMTIERWFMQSCDAVSVYEVHVKISRRGESDIVHQRLDLTP